MEFAYKAPDYLRPKIISLKEASNPPYMGVTAYINNEPWLVIGWDGEKYELENENRERMYLSSIQWDGNRDPLNACIAATRAVNDSPFINIPLTFNRESKQWFLATKGKILDLLLKALEQAGIKVTIITNEKIDDQEPENEDNELESELENIEDQLPLPDHSMTGIIDSIMEPLPNNLDNNDVDDDFLNEDEDGCSCKCEKGACNCDANTCKCKNSIKVLTVDFSVRNARRGDFKPALYFADKNTLVIGPSGANHNQLRLVLSNKEDIDPFSGIEMAVSRVSSQDSLLIYDDIDDGSKTKLKATGYSIIERVSKDDGYMLIEDRDDFISEPVKCPHCKSHTVKMLIPKVESNSVFRCLACGKRFEQRVEINPRSLRASNFIDVNGRPIQPGKWYILRSKKWTVPDTIKILSSDENMIVATTDPSSIHSMEIQTSDIEREGYEFEPYDIDLPDNHPLNLHTSRRLFTPAEQKELIDEPGNARNKHKLDLSGTHYLESKNDSLDIYFLW